MVRGERDPPKRGWEVGSSSWLLNGATHVDLGARLVDGFSEHWWAVATAVGAAAFVVGGAIGSCLVERRLRQRLAAAEERFQLLAENSSDIVIRVGREERVRWVSPAVTPVLGWLPDEWVGRSIFELFSAGEDGEEVLRQSHRSTGSGKSTVVRSRMPAKGGEDHWVEVHAGPWRTADQKSDGMVVSLRVVDAEEHARQILERQACTDELTSLFNRREALVRMHSLNSRSGESVAVLWCDVDWFKQVNDTHGHATGDAVLQQLADRIRKSLRTSDDLAARMGGDELMVVLHGVRTLQDACDVAEKIRLCAAEPIPTAVGPVSVTLSIGVTVARPFEPADAVIARADTAMYRAKQSGRNRVVAVPEGQATEAEVVSAAVARRASGAASIRIQPAGVESAEWAGSTPAIPPDGDLPPGASNC